MEPGRDKTLMEDTRCKHSLVERAEQRDRRRWRSLKDTEWPLLGTAGGLRCMGAPGRRSDTCLASGVGSDDTKCGNGPARHLCKKQEGWGCWGKQGRICGNQPARLPDEHKASCHHIKRVVIKMSQGERDECSPERSHSPEEVVVENRQKSKLPELSSLACLPFYPFTNSWLRKNTPI